MMEILELFDNYKSDDSVIASIYENDYAIICLVVPKPRKDGVIEYGPQPLWIRYDKANKTFEEVPFPVKRADEIMNEQINSVHKYGEVLNWEDDDFED